MKLKSALIPRPVTVLAAKRESHDMVTLTLDEKSRHKPGQFYQVTVPGIGEAPISISSCLKGRVNISVRSVGNVTRALGRMKRGSTLFIRGPYGNGYPLQDYKGYHCILIGGGCGVAPLKGAIDYFEHHGDDYADIHLFLGFRSPDDIIFQRELTKWKKTHHVTVTVDTIPSGSCYAGTAGFVTEGLKALTLIDAKRTIAIMCGPPQMMKACAGILEKKGLDLNQVFLSTERMMYCALGNCCHCMIRGTFVCTDGPVFRYADITDQTND